MLKKPFDIVTDALTAFGLTAADSGHFADVLAAASTNANTNVGMMRENFKYAAPVAGALGFSCEMTFLSNLPTLIASAKAALSGALSGVLAPVIAVVAVITVLVSAFKYLWDTNEEFRNAILEKGIQKNKS